MYDTYGHAGLSGVEHGQRTSTVPSSRTSTTFSGIFLVLRICSAAGGRGRGRTQRGADLRYDMTLTFEEASAGVTTKVKLPRQEYCEACNGTGAKKGTGATTCQTCAVAVRWLTSRDFSPSRARVRRARARGRLFASAAWSAAEQGRLEREKTIELRIPPGVDTGTRLRVTGEGEPGPNGGPAGDLYVVLDVKEHQFFERRGADLYCTIPLSIAQATLGTELQVPGLERRREAENSRRHAERRGVSR